MRRNGYLCMFFAAVVFHQAAVMADVTSYWPSGGGSVLDDRGRCVAVDSAGEALTAGTFQGTAVFGDFTVHSEGLEDIVIIKYNPAGGIEWVTTAGGAQGDDVVSITVDPSGNVYVAGVFSGQARFGGITAVGDADGQPDVFVAKIDAVGVWRWVVTGRGPGNDEAADLVFVPGDNTAIPHVPGTVIVGGRYRCDIDFNGHSLSRSSCNSEAAPYLVRIDTDGNVSWVDDGGSSGGGDGGILSLDVDSDGVLYAAGQVWQDLTLSGTTVRPFRTWEQFSHSGDWFLTTVFGRKGLSLQTMSVADDSLQTTDIDLSTAVNPHLSFYQLTLVNTWPDPAEVLEISIDGGGWEDITAHCSFISGSYDSYVSQAGHPLDGRHAWGESSYPETSHEVDLSAVAGHHIRLRWRVVTSDMSENHPLILLDDVVVSEGVRSFFFADMEKYSRDFFASLSNLSTAAPVWNWVREAPQFLNTRELRLAGNQIDITGNALRTVFFGSSGLADPGALVAAADRMNGDWRWAGLIGSDVDAVALTVDTSENIYFTGAFSGSLDIAGEQLNSTGGSEDFCVVALTSTGQPSWATGGDRYDAEDGIPGKGGGPGEDRPAGIATVNDSLYVVGSFEQTAEFGDDEQIHSLGAGDLVTVALSSTGRQFNYESWIVGEEIPPPEGAYVSSSAAQPELYIDWQPAELGKYFFWQGPVDGDPDGHLYAIAPVEDVQIRWRAGPDLADPSRVISVGSSMWPTDRCLPSTAGACYQVHVVGAPVELEPDDAHLSYFSLLQPETGSSNASVSEGVFKAEEPGWAVITYVEGSVPDPTAHRVHFEIVRSYGFRSAPEFADNIGWPIGTEITDAFHDQPGRTGFVLNETAFFDGVGGSAALNREQRTGQIIPVNRVNPNRAADRNKDMTVVWYRRNHNRVYWAERPIRYDCYWPVDPDVIIISSEKGGEVRGQAPLDSVSYPGAVIYDQPDPAKAGFNPNDEHALMAPSNSGSGSSAVFALRADFGTPINPLSTDASDPYVLIKYHTADSRWAFRVYRVLAVSPDYPGFSFTGTAGDPIAPPYPVSEFPKCSEDILRGETAYSAWPFFEDVHGQVWAASEGRGTVGYFYPIQAGFFYDINGNDISDAAVGQCIPWMARLPESMGGSAGSADPIEVSYQISWPEDVPLLEVGETLLKPKRGLPDIYDQAAVQVVYDQGMDTRSTELADPTASLAQVIRPFDLRSVPLEILPPDLATATDDDGKLIITASADLSVRLPVTLRRRLRWDPMTESLQLGGLFDESGAGEPLVLINVLSDVEKSILLDASSDEDWQTAVEALQRLSRNPQGIESICHEVGVTGSGQLYCLDYAAVTDDEVLIGWRPGGYTGAIYPLRSSGVHAALSAGAAHGEGFVTLAFNNDESLGGLPVSLAVIRIGCLEYPEPPADPEITAPYMGEIKILPPDNVFDENLTLHFNGDFGGRSDEIEFEWYYHPDEDGTPPEPPDPEHGQMNGWIRQSAPALGAVDITIGGADLQTLADNWYLVRYRGLHACDNETHWSLWAGQPGSTPLEPRAQLAEGWVKRVVTALNPFEARVKDFHKAATNTFASMIEQIGPRYEGDIALNPSAENLNSIGLIEAYETVLHRARELSIDGTPPVDYDPANSAILNVTSRLADFYLLLGNEAFADAEDPTVGISTDEVQFNIGSLAPAIFNFENQVPSLLDEELVLLRGRDDSAGPVAAPPVYNRFYWNFTGGNGEVAYALSYDIHDVNIDGDINAEDAKIQYPQGHGDAWGHDLTAITHYYELLRHPYFTWVPRPEAVLVAGVPIQVDYFDERKFASIAAAKADVGAEVVNLSYRSAYTEDPAGQWQGYRDSDTQRAWGLDGWGKRAGQGAFFDWVTANAILPARDPDPSHEGLEKIDRTTVHELDQIVSNYMKIQAEIDAADQGLNPLGLAKNALLFDIDPAQVDAGKTHFEQIYERAAQALDSAVSVWDYANELNRMLRFNQDDVQKMRENAHSTEVDFKNRLIEIFGYPYPEDISPGGSYPEGYDGPDLYHYMCIDPKKLPGLGYDLDDGNPGSILRFTARYTPVDSGISFLGLDENSEGIDELCRDNPTAEGCVLGPMPDYEFVSVSYVSWTDLRGRYYLIKPPEWTGERRSVGKIEEALEAVINAESEMETELAKYNALLGDVMDQIDLIRATYNIRSDEILVANELNHSLDTLATAVYILQTISKTLGFAAEGVDKLSKDISDCIPKMEIAGTADGGDLFSTARCGVKILGTAGWGVLQGASLGFQQMAQGAQGRQSIIEQTADLKIRIDDARLELYGLTDELNKLVRQEPVLRAELFDRAQHLDQAHAAFLKALAEGQRLLGRLVTFRKNTAAGIEEYRFEDMAFRIFRNDALQKYRAAFDMAARYTYLAASAYDYDTSLLGTDGKAGQAFLTDIVRQQSLGQILDGEPVPGTPGLADPMGRMQLDFEVLKGQMGFDDPEIESNGISLRRELLRLKDDEAGDTAWRKALETYRVDDLWQVPEFRHMARSFAPEDAGPQPGLVIPFETTVNYGLNFFGHPLGEADHAFDASRFATRIRAVGVALTGYDTLPLSETPRVYLLPAGEDFLRSGGGADGEAAVRQWKVLDQVIPVPYPVNSSDLAAEGWTPLADMLDGPFSRQRRFSAFRAYPDGPEPLSDSQMDGRLVSRSVWNSRWVLIIPGATMLDDAAGALDTFIEGREKPDGSGRDGQGVSDIRLFLKTYAYEGLKK